MRGAVARGDDSWGRGRPALAALPVRVLGGGVLSCAFSGIGCRAAGIGPRAGYNTMLGRERSDERRASKSKTRTVSACNR
jgi:hypothetical protein